MSVLSVPFSRPGRRLRDAAIRVIGIPALGLLIPRFTGTLEGLAPAEPLYWAGTLWFLLLSSALWMGNRWLLFRLRDRHDWTDRPLAKLASIVAATSLYTVAVAGLMLVAWYAADGRPGLDWPGLALNLAVILPVVLGVTHLYETLFLIGDRLADRLDLERTERARLQAELATLRNQLTPHFLFNSLNTLGVLIDENPRAARQFNRHLASVCRYLLAQSSRDLVPLYQELDFFQAYTDLARLRFPDSLQITLDGFESVSALQIPPASLQLLLENAIKHNTFSAQHPLLVSLVLERDRITVANPVHTRANHSDDSVGHGLRSLRERFQITVGTPIEIADTGTRFSVTLPLVRV